MHHDRPAARGSLVKFDQATREPQASLFNDDVPFCSVCPQDRIYNCIATLANQTRNRSAAVFPFAHFLSFAGALHMPDRTPGSLDYLEQPEAELSLWDNEGGAGPRHAKEDLLTREVQQPPPAST